MLEKWELRPLLLRWVDGDHGTREVWVNQHVLDTRCAWASSTSNHWLSPAGVHYYQMPSLKWTTKKKKVTCEDCLSGNRYDEANI